MWPATTRGKQSTSNEEDGVRGNPQWGVRATWSKWCFTKVELQNRAREEGKPTTPEVSLDK